MAKYAVDYLARLEQAIIRFQVAFEDWMTMQQESDHTVARGLLPTVYRRANADEAVVRNLELVVAEAVGGASQAVRITGAYIAVAGVGPIDPIANWALMSSPKALVTPQEVRLTAATIRGRLTAMRDESENDSDVGGPDFAPSKFHSIVWTAAADHWTSHQYRVAVRESAEALTLHWKSKLGRTDVDDTVFWQQTLSPSDPEPGKPKLSWPGDPQDKTTKSMRGGLEPLTKSLAGLASGLNLTVRNPTTHTRTELSEQEAMERLAAYSYLARLLDQCEIRRAL